MFRTLRLTSATSSWWSVHFRRTVASVPVWTPPRTASNSSAVRWRLDPPPSWLLRRPSEASAGPCSDTRRRRRTTDWTATRQQRSSNYRPRSGTRNAVSRPVFCRSSQYQPTLLRRCSVSAELSCDESTTTKTVSVTPLCDIARTHLHKWTQCSNVNAISYRPEISNLARNNADTWRMQTYSC